MKKLLSGVIAAITLFSLYSFHLAHKTYENIFIQLGLEKSEAESYIDGNILEGGDDFPRSEIMYQLARNKRGEVVKEIGNYIKAYVNTPGFAKQYQGIREEAKPVPPPNGSDKEDMAAYKMDLKYWEAEYPNTIKELLKIRLKEFLERTADIKFDAKLERSGRKMIFSDPELEAKDALWKACFRSGKETVEAARSFAQQWLQELK